MMHRVADGIPRSTLRRLLMVTVLCGMVHAGSGADSWLGRKPPEWTATHWINSEPLELAKLAGKVVLVRWWTAPGCPYCAATAPALNEFHDRWAKEGLVVVGMDHHKSAAPLDLDVLKRHVARLGFKFPVAIDPEWQTLNQWWLDTGREKWTSASFLIGRDGVVRYIHPGGQYVKGDADYAALKAKIEKLLRE